jgi:uncharacterized protein (DUF305 family)
MGLSRRSVLLASLLTVSLGAAAVAPIPPARAQMPMDPHEGHDDPHREHRIQEASPAEEVRPHGDHADHADHAHDVGPAGATYDLRFLDAMVQHHTGALRMSEFVFDIGEGGVGALAKTIWRDQAQEIRAMGQWRKRWYPEAPVYPVVLAPGGDPDRLEGLARMSAEQITAMRMMGTSPSRENRVIWFLEGMIEHHGGALLMAHDALAKSANPTIRRFARDVIRAQRAEIIELRRMLRTDGLRKPEYFRFDSYFSP